MEKYVDMFNPTFLKNTSNVLPPLPADASVTMAYVPFQQQPVIYEEESKALSEGTLFPELNKPFTGKGVLI